MELHIRGSQGGSEKPEGPLARARWRDVTVTCRETAVGLTHIVRLGLSLGELVLVQGETGGDPTEPHVPQHVLVICHLPAAPRTGAYRKNAPRSDPAEVRRQAATGGSLLSQTQQQEPSNFPSTALQHAAEQGCKHPGPVPQPRQWLHTPVTRTHGSWSVSLLSSCRYKTAATPPQNSQHVKLRRRRAQAGVSMAASWAN